MGVRRPAAANMLAYRDRDVAADAAPVVESERPQSSSEDSEDSDQATSTTPRRRSLKEFFRTGRRLDGRASESYTGSSEVDISDGEEANSSA